MIIRYLKILLFLVITMLALISLAMGSHNTKVKDKPVHITQVYDLQFMDANTIYQQMDNMHKQGFKITNSNTFQQFDVTVNLWTTKWEVHYVK